MTLPHFEQAADVLVDALRQDPFYLAITAGMPVESPAWRDCLSQYFLYALHEGEKYGVTFLSSPETIGAAIWLFPQEPDVQQALDRQKGQFLEGLLGR